MSAISNTYAGVLEKKARDRTLLAKLTGKLTGRTDAAHSWKQRNFVLEGQTLKYMDGGGVLKGTMDVRDNSIRKVVAEEANGKEYAFELTLPHGNQGQEEKVYLSAESNTARAKWISVLIAAGVAEKWQLRPKTLLKKTGRDVANALVAGPRDDRQLLVLQTLQDGTNRAHYLARLDAAAAELEDLEGTIQQQNQGGSAAGQNLLQLKLTRHALQEKVEGIVKNRAAYIIQALLRRTKSLRRVREAKLAKAAVGKIEKLVLAFLFRRVVRRRLVDKHARHVINSMLIRRLAQIRKLAALRAAPRVIVIEGVKGEDIKFDEACASADFFFYVMSCYDPTGQFRGNEETRVEHGYGLRATSVFRSEGIKFHITPDWGKQAAIVTGSNAQCFLVVTLVTRASTSKNEVFHGQAIIKLWEHPEIFDGRGTRVAIAKSPLVKYVAPLEDVSGTSMLSINEALHRRVDGVISFTVRLAPNLYTATGPLCKESGRMLSSEFKRRFFVLHDNRLFYCHGESVLGSVKHSILCKEVTALTREKCQGRDCLRIHFFSYSLQKKGSWLVHFPDDVGLAQRLEWVRKLHRCCAGLPPDCTDVQSVKKGSDNSKKGPMRV